MKGLYTESFFVTDIVVIHTMVPSEEDGQGYYCSEFSTVQYLREKFR